MFAHDGKEAQKTLLRSYTGDDEQRKTEMLERTYKEFVDFVVKDLIADIATETSVTLEFMNRSERKSITSSNSIFTEIEDIEELKEDASPLVANNNGKTNHSHTYRMSTNSTDSLIESH